MYKRRALYKRSKLVCIISLGYLECGFSLFFCIKGRSWYIL
nr:MAG TPA: hypothetical protein [Caudoviricetes sp.]